jgi:hypothetical protein
MGYEPELNDPIFYEEEQEREIKCFSCSDPLDQDDIVWADEEGQIINQGNDNAWCVSCLPSEKEKEKEKENE